MPCCWCLQAFQLLPEYLQILENYSGLSSVQEMGRGIEVIVIILLHLLLASMSSVECIEPIFISKLSFGMFKEQKKLVHHQIEQIAV